MVCCTNYFTEEQIMSQSDIVPPTPEDENKNEMMDLFFQEDLAKLHPPEEVSIANLIAEPYEDGRRVRVNIEINPFEKRPHLEFNLTDSKGQEISTTSFVEPMTWKLEFTMHVRSKPADGPLDLEARLFYPDGPEAEPVRVRFNLPST